MAEAQVRRKQNTGNIIGCLELALHHIDEHKPELLEAADALNVPSMKYRFRILREELREVLERVNRIKRIAEQQHLQGIIDILVEKFEFGHDLDGISEEERRESV